MDSDHQERTDPHYLARERHPLTRDFYVAGHKNYSSVVRFPGQGFYLVLANTRCSGKTFFNGREVVKKGFDVYFMDEQGNARLFVKGLDTAHEAFEAIWGYIDAVRSDLDG